MRTGRTAMSLVLCELQRRILCSRSEPGTTDVTVSVKPGTAAALRMNAEPKCCKSMTSL